MGKKEHRKSDRIEATHFISYDLLDKEGDVRENGMALSLDLSREGVLLENRTDFPQNSTVAIYIAVGEDVVDLAGRVRHSEKIAEDKFRIGIQFKSMTDDQAQKLADHYPELFRQ
jgi:hypothetical protein